LVWYVSKTAINSANFVNRLEVDASENTRRPDLSELVFFGEMEFAYLDAKRAFCVPASCYSKSLRGNLMA